MAGFGACRGYGRKVVVGQSGVRECASEEGSNQVDLSKSVARFPIYVASFGTLRRTASQTLGEGSRHEGHPREGLSLDYATLEAPFPFEMVG